MMIHNLIFGTYFIHGRIQAAISRKSLYTSLFKSCGKSQIYMVKFSFCKKASSQDKSSEIINCEDKIKLKKYIEMLRYLGKYVPKHISDENYLELLKLPSNSSKTKFLDYLYNKELAKKEFKIEKEKKKESNLKAYREKQTRIGHIEYALWKNSMFIRARVTSFNLLLNNRLVNAMKFNQPLVIDLDFYNYMTKKEISFLAEQLKHSVICNRVNSEPFNLMMCNVDFDCEKFQVFSKKRMPNVLKPHFPINITTKSYLDLFPKEKLVYLTADAQCEMQTFDYDAIYIIGGIAEKGRVSPLSLAKAKRENIKMMKLPLDKYHIFKKSKNLDINVMIEILLDLQKDGDWVKALKNIPRRLLQTGDETHIKTRRKF